MSAGSLDRDGLRQVLQRGVDALALTLGKDSVERLLDFTSLLVKWNKVYNLTAVRDPRSMVTQHLLDSLAAVPFIADAQRLLDVGAGGGLPGIVFAVWAAENAPAMTVTMVDTVQKKTAFLTQAKAELGLKNVTVLTGRVEQLPADSGYDVISSRAFAELKDFINWSGHLLAPGGRFVAMKGQHPEQEIASLPVGWKLVRIEPLVVPGLDAERHVVVIARDGEGA